VDYIIAGSEEELLDNREYVELVESGDLFTLYRVVDGKKLIIPQPYE
jgi:hypothetical protein